MQAYVYRLIEKLLNNNGGAGCEMITHPELDDTLFPEAQYKQVFSVENTRLHYEQDGGLITIERPLKKLIVLIGGTNVTERIVSYSMPYDIESLAGAEWDRSGHDKLLERTSTVRISLIASDTVERQAVAALEYGKIFLQYLLWNPPEGIEDWWSRAATLDGFTDLFALPHTNISGFDEQEILGCWFGAKFKETLLPSEHVAIRLL